MAFFRYTAKDSRGTTLKGKIEAKNERAAAYELVQRQLFVISITPVGEETLQKLGSALFGVKQNDIVTFTRQLSTMISAGLPLANALSILAQQSKSEMSRLVSTILQDIEGGMTFGKALEKHPQHFGNLYIQLIRAGEVGGVLDSILNRLADNMEKAKVFRAKTRGALIYPVIVVIAMIVVAFIMMMFVIPKMMALYEDFDADLPFLTSLLMGISGFMVTYWWMMLIIFAVIGVSFYRWRKTYSGQHTFDRMMLRMPLFGSLIQKITLTEFTRTLSLLLGAGVSLLQAMEIVTDGVDNIIYKDALQESTKKIEKGVSLSQAISNYQDFPPILFQMVAVGEETGKLDEVLGKLAKYFDEESEQAVKNLTAAIEPMIMIVLGIGVGAMVIAVIMPIYNLTSQF